ncbi:MAG: glyoxalase superfamily protein [Rhodovibrionaceae bacterium]
MIDCAPPIPILRIFDEEKAKAFYCDFLGFALDWEHRFAAGMPLYCQVRQGRCRLHLSEHHGDATPGSALRIEIGDVKAFAATLRGKNYGNARPGTLDQPWGFRECAIADPFGNRLIFCQRLES